MITPKFLQELISSPEYGDKNSETYKRATRYMNILYPGTVAFDAIEKFRKLQKIKERGAVKPGHWTEVKINQELEKKQSEKKI